MPPAPERSAAAHATQTPARRAGDPPHEMRRGTPPYPVLLVPETEGGYTALIPGLPGCLSVGETPEEALAMIRDALRLWLETVREAAQE